jgi:hypothetical protein
MYSIQDIYKFVSIGLLGPLSDYVAEAHADLC